MDYENGLNIKIEPEEFEDTYQSNVDEEPLITPYEPTTERLPPLMWLIPAELNQVKIESTEDTGIKNETISPSKTPVPLVTQKNDTTSSSSTKNQLKHPCLTGKTHPRHHPYAPQQSEEEVPTLQTLDSSLNTLLNYSKSIRQVNSRDPRLQKKTQDKTRSEMALEIKLQKQDAQTQTSKIAETLYFELDINAHRDLPKDKKDLLLKFMKVKYAHFNSYFKL